MTESLRIRFMNRRSRRSAEVHEDDLCHWYYNVGVICAPDGSQDFVTVTADRTVFDEWYAAGRGCPECAALLHS